MPKRSSKLDVNQMAADILAHAIAEAPAPMTPDGKNAAAVALGRKGGLKGGKARAESLSAKRRAEIAKKAARSRWNKTR